MRFAKMQGVGNDFVVISAPFTWGTPEGGVAFMPDADARLAELARRVCSRRFGIGADGLLVTGPGHFRMRMFNPDGSEDMCGNGLRCVAFWYSRRGLYSNERRDGFVIDTKDGPRRVKLLSVNDDNTEALLSVDMGRPRFAPADVPFTGGSAGGGVVDVSLPVGGTALRVTAVNTGSTHTVIWSDTDVDEETFTRLSPPLENHPLFPERTSVLWATVTGANDVQIRIWERGAGETLGCGTGACAVAVAARVQGKVGDGPVRVTSRGGTLTIDWPGGDADMVMTGPAVLVYEGNI